MKLFGKKDSNAAAPEELAGDDLGEMDAGLEELEGAAAPAEKALSAPSRSMSGAAGGGRKNLLVLVALLVVAGIAGGYFWFMGGNDEPIHVTAQQTPVTPPADMAAATPPMPTPAAADPMAAPATPAADPMAAPAADPMAVPAADPAAAVTPVMPATDVAVAAGAAATPAGDPLAATAPAAGNPADPFATPAADPAAAPAATDPAAAAAVLGQPPADEATAIAAVPAAAPPADAPPADPADDQAPDAPAAMAAPSTPDGMPPQPAAADPAVAGAAPVEAAPAESAPSWAAPGTAVVPGTTNPAANATSPNDAELAIVQHADVMDQLSRPADTQTAVAAGAAAATPATGAPFDPAAASKTVNRNAMKTVGEILEQPGIVRPLPSGYMTIRKESDAGSIDSRLTKARAALAEGNNSAALELFDDLHKDYPKDKRILMGRAVSLHKMGQKDEALSAYEDVLNRDPKNLDALNNMLGLLKEKDPQLAVEKLQELHDAYPYQGDIAAQLGVAYGSTGQYDQALRYLDLAEGLKPGTSFVLYNKSVLLDKMGRGREAASLYRQILRMAADGDLDQNLPLDSIRRRLAALQ
ncbi:MAG: tetratricopeptide repeat protein [Alphaproteobacteria bacterium]|nr:tetratricopeptide repeat protein [Alphaproteobacteria bacterium]